MSSQRNRNIAMRRLKRDLIELERADIPSIAAKPCMDDNIFEWHVNIKPTDGVYSGVYFHLIMTFPETYPTKPPTVKICTPISHPNIFDSFLCLSMLRPHTSNVPYEGWSSAYSATSVLMQLQSFLFAEKIDQDGGYTTNAQLSDYDVNRSIKICKQFKCSKCSHCHDNPWPKIKGQSQALIKVIPTDPESGHVTVQGSSCQTTHTDWVGANGEYGINKGKVFYEAYINWMGDKWSRHNLRGGLFRFGFGTEDAFKYRVGESKESFGYGALGCFAYANKFDVFGESFTKNDTITVALDFESKQIYFGKNGRLMPNELRIPDYLMGKVLYPLVSFKNSRIEFNFGIPKKPCNWLIKKGFKSLEQVSMEKGTMTGEADDYKEIEDMPHNVDWHNQGVIDELWVWIFESLQVDEVFSAQFVCKKWQKLLVGYGIIERNEICCYHTKARLGQEVGGHILGIGINIKPNDSGYGVGFKSQMDILSLDAWENGCQIGVWGESLTHFLPLVMNKKHAAIANDAIYEYLEKIRIGYQTGKDSQIKNKSNFSNNWRTGNNNKFDIKVSEEKRCLQLIDILITMMNQIVVQFSMDKKLSDHWKVTMVMCEKVVLGYCALHHLLLYLANKHKDIVDNFVNDKISSFINNPDGCSKVFCKDLGHFLIYLLISSKYSWSDVANTFVKEVFTRNVRWMVQDAKYKRYDTTNIVDGRLKDTFVAAKVSRRLVMFQVWFMKNNAQETLQGYNKRLGRPRLEVRNGIVSKTKEILQCKSWWDYFNELGVIIKDENAIDQLLRFAIYNSKQNMYHRTPKYGVVHVIEKVIPPLIKAIDESGEVVDVYDPKQDVNNNMYDFYTDSNIQITESFERMGLRRELINGIHEHGWKKPLGIQQLAIMPIISSQNIIGHITQSGVGKTGAFCIPAIHRVSPYNRSCQILIVTSNQETSNDIFDIINKLGLYMKRTCYSCIESIQDDISALKKGKQIVIGTAKRINDLIIKDVLKVNRLRLFVIDEADKIVKQGFSQQILNIFQYLPRIIQVALFSATMPSDVLEIRQRFIKNPIKILIRNRNLISESIKHWYVAVEIEDYKLATLFDLYDSVKINKAIVFINTKHKLLWVRDNLLQNDFAVSFIHNDLLKQEKELVIKEFRSGSNRILLSTDHDSITRDIMKDVGNVSLIINYDLPKWEESYIYRIGTGNNNKTGCVINFIPDDEEEKLTATQAYYNIKIEELPQDLLDIGL